MIEYEIDKLMGRRQTSRHKWVTIPVEALVGRVEPERMKQVVFAESDFNLRRLFNHAVSLFNNRLEVGLVCDSQAFRNDGHVQPVGFVRIEWLALAADLVAI